MVSAPAARATPGHRLAWIGFSLAIVSLVLAWYGSLHAEKHIAGSPLREARGPANVIAEPGSWYERAVDRIEIRLFGTRFDQKILTLTERSKIARYSLQIVAFFLPVALGLLAAILGGRAMTAIEHSAGSRMGHFQAVFSIMIGGFAAVLGGCMLVSVFLWPLLPSAYTL